MPAEPSPCLRLVALPDGVADDEDKVDALYRAISDEQVEAQVVAYGGRGWVRLSGCGVQRAGRLRAPGRRAPAPAPHHPA